MDETLQQQITFHLTGNRGNSALKPMTSAYRPALFARYADLTSLRYDFPLILNREGAIERALLSLSRLVDDVVSGMTGEPERDRIARHGYQIERELRRSLAAGGTFDFATLWKEAVAKLAAVDEDINSSAKLLWMKFYVSGNIIDVDAKLPLLAVRHLWQAVEKEKARVFKDRAERLLYKLHNILEAEAQGSAIGRAPERLRAGFGSTFAGTFDFNVLSRVIGESKPSARLSDSRRERILRVINILEGQRFYPINSDGGEAYNFEFDTCEKAIRAFQGRQTEAAELLRALAVGDLESKGEYREAAHDAIFDGARSDGLDISQLSQLPSYLIATNTANLTADEISRIVELMSIGMPMKVLVQADDILETSQVFAGHIGLGSVPRQLVKAAIGLTNVFVLQSSASALFDSRGSLTRGLTFDGPALFSIFSGANPFTREHPYLVAAAAVESRAFPGFLYDPAGGGDWSTRFAIDDNPSADSDWPVYSFEYEDESLQWSCEKLPFTLAEFLSLDERFHKHFALVPRNDCSDAMITVPEQLGSDADPMPKEVPALSLVDDQFRLQRAIVDMRAMREVRRCLSMWRSQQELGGINNSYVERLLAKGYAPVADNSPVTPAQIQGTSAVLDAAAIEETESASAKAETDEAYIETPRCTTCNECTQVNNKMFAYNADKQAYIADATAGTFRELVEAAESCQVGIIHPGKPQNLKEPGLEDLVKRAAEFN